MCSRACLLRRIDRQESFGPASDRKRRSRKPASAEAKNTGIWSVPVAPKCVSRRKSSPSQRDTRCSKERRAINGVFGLSVNRYRNLWGLSNRRIGFLSEKIGNDPGRSGYREILCVAGPIEHFVDVGKKCRQPYQQREADQHQCE